MTVDQFVSEHLTSPQPGARPGYLAQHQLLAQVPALRRDILVPDYCYTGLQVRCRISEYHTRCMYLSSPGRGPGDPRLDRARRHRVPRTHRQEAQVHTHRNIDFHRNYKFAGPLGPKACEGT